MITHHLHLTAVKKKLVPSLTKNPLCLDPGLNQSFQVFGFLVEPVNIQLSHDAVLIQKPARHVTMSLKDKFEQKIHSLGKLGIIYKLDHNKATEWLNSFVVVKKPSGDLRICLDLTDLNRCIVRPVCNLNTLE